MAVRALVRAGSTSLTVSWRLPVRTIFASSRMATRSPGLPACDPPPPDPLAALRSPVPASPGAAGAADAAAAAAGAPFALVGADAADPLHAATTAPTAVRTRTRVADGCGRRREVGLR